MAASTAVKDSFDIEYVNSSKGGSKPAQVHLFVRGHRHKLQVTKITDKKCKILDEIWVENIGALVIALLKTKRKYHQCLFVLSKRSDDDINWDQMIILDSDNPNHQPCVEQLKVLISTKCFQCGPIKMKDISGAVHQLQCSRRYIAITPEDGEQKLKSADIRGFCKEISGSIYAKCNREISVINEPSSCTSVIKLQTGNGQTFQYTLCNGRTADMISRELSVTVEPRNPLSPLPPTPSTKLEDVAPPSWVPRDCGVAPALGEKPFWINTIVPVNPEDPHSIYRADGATDLKPYLKNKMEHIQSVCRRKPSKRLHEFIDAVKIEPTMVDTTELQAQQIAVYRRPRLSTLITEQPTISTTKFSKDNVESTLADCLKKIIRRNFEAGLAEDCPIGMTNHERVTFCWRLDLVENTIEGGTGWKAFACHVMQLDNEDLEMIDEFSCKYKCQVVEVVLDHWYKLYTMGSRKCLCPANKQTIIQVLRLLEKDDLLYKLNWQHD